MVIQKTKSKYIKLYQKGYDVMKILDIYKHITETNNKIYDVINETLKSGSYNEALYYKYTIMVNIEIEKNNDYLLMLYYRAFWESIGDPHNIYDTTNPKRHSFRMSLMTAIEIIYEATPPLLQSEIKNSITSIDNIIEILKTYVLENNSDVNLRRGIFFKKNGMFDYGGIWNDSDDRTNKIRSIIDKDTSHPPVIAYVDVEVGEFKQYVISGPVDKLMLMTTLVRGLNLTHVYVNPPKTLTSNPIVHIKGYTECKYDFTLEELNTLCEKTLKMLE